MKNLAKTVTIAFSCFAVIACGPDRKAEQSLNDYEKFVTDHNDNVERYADANWSDIEKEYNDAKRNVEENYEHFDSHMKDRYESMKMDWQKFHENYLAEVNKKETAAATQMVMNSLLPEGIQEDLSDVTNANILEVYKHFVSAVDAMKDNLTREQWDHVEIMWERLDTRKNELEKDMKADVKLAIAEQKVVYGAFKVANRPVAKGEENADAKDKDNNNDNNKDR